jgi:hypothetical protein
LANRHYGQSFPVQWAENCWKSQQRYTPQIGRIPKRVADSLKCFAIQITILICDAFCHKIHDAGFNAIVDSKLTHLQSIEFCILHFAFCILHFGFFILGPFFFFAWDGFGGQTRRHSTWDGFGGQTRNSPGFGFGLTRKKQVGPGTLSLYSVLPSGPVFSLITVGENNLGGRQKSTFCSLLGEYIPTSARTLGVWCKNNVLTSVTSVRTGFTPMLLHWSQCYYIGVVLHCFKNVWVHK